MVRKRKISDLAAELVLKQSIVELKKLTAEQVAKRLGVSWAYITRRFKKDQRISLRAFILREKLHRAFFVLSKDGGKSIDELARELGFLKVENFNVEFEKYHAIAPAKYRDIICKMKKRKRDILAIETT